MLQFALVLSLAGFEAFGAPLIRFIGRANALNCRQEIENVAASSVERRHPNRVSEAYIAFPDTAAKAFQFAGSHPKSAQFPATALDEVSSNDRHRPTIVREATLAYTKAIDDDQFVFCALPFLCNNGEVLPAPSYWLGSIGEDGFDVHGQPDDDQMIRDPEPVELAAQLAVAGGNGPKYIAFMRGFPKKEFLTINEAENLLGAEMMMIAGIASTELLDGWARRNLDRHNSEIDADSLFVKYGKIINGRPSLESGFVQTFIETRGLETAIATFHRRGDLSENLRSRSPELWVGLKSYAGTAHIITDEKIGPNEVFSQVQQWTDLMKLAAEPEADR